MTTRELVRQNPQKQPNQQNDHHQEHPGKQPK